MRPVVADLLAAVPTRCASLLLEGPAGIGKTYLWSDAVRAARDLGWQVLTARPTGAETSIGTSALVDLFADVDDDDLARLPDPQRRALSAAVLRADVDDIAPEPLAVPV